jgi:hypothetical protein
MTNQSQGDAIKASGRRVGRKVPPGGSPGGREYRMRTAPLPEHQYTPKDWSQPRRSRTGKQDLAK